LWGLSEASIFGHYHFDKPACPGYDIQKWIEDVRSNYKQRLIDPVKVSVSLAEKGYIGATIREQQKLLLKKNGYPPEWIDFTKFLNLVDYLTFREIWDSLNEEKSNV
jgi:hypothetical protein